MRTNALSLQTDWPKLSNSSSGSSSCSSLGELELRVLYCHEYPLFLGATRISMV